MHRVDVDPRRIVVELVAAVELAPHPARSVRSRKPPCSSYDAVITARTSRAPRSVSPAAVASASGRPQERLHPVEPVGRERQRARAAGLADRAARPRRVADERPLRAALGTAADVRQVAGQPEQLELEREPERVELRREAATGASSSRSRNRVSAANARSFASCSVKSRSIASAPISPTASRYGLVAHGAVRTDQLDSGDGVQLAAPLRGASARRGRAARAGRRPARSSSGSPSRSRRRARGRTV